MYNNFLTYVAVEKNRYLKLLLFKMLAFCKSFEGAPDNELVRDVYRFGEWMQNDSALYVEEGFKLADAAQHAAHEACCMFGNSSNIRQDWGMDFQQYFLFNSICHDMEYISVRTAVMDFEWQIHKEQDNDLEM